MKSISLATMLFAVLLSIIEGAWAGPTIHSVRFDIPEQPLASALQVFSIQGRIQVVRRDEAVSLGDTRAPAVAGTFPPEEALDRLLSGSDFTYEFVNPRTVRIARRSVRLVAMALDQGMQASSASGSASFGDSSVPVRDRLEEVIVTAQKRAQNLQDVPVSIAALTGDDLAQAQVTNFSQLSTAVPGLSIADSGPNYRMVFIRGLGNVELFGSAPLVGTYLDETAVSGFGAGALDVRPYDLARVEVLRGPQGTLYGEGSMGGTIRFVTNDPQLDRLSGSGNLSLSFTEEGGTSRNAIVMGNVPLVTDKLALRMAAQLERSAGWIDQPSAKARDINDQELADVRAKMLWQPSEDLSISALVNVHRNNAGAPNYGENEEGNYTQKLGRTTVPGIDDDFDIYNLSVTYDFGSFSLLNSASYQQSRKQLHDVGNIIYLSGPPPTPADELLFNWTYESRQRADELRLASTDAGPWNWTVGAYYRTADFDIVGPYEVRLVSAGIDVPVDYVKQMSTKSWSVFGQTGYTFFNRMEIGVGFRYFRDDQELFNGAVLQEETFDSLDPRVYVSFDLGASTRLYASAAKGFRSGGFNVDVNFPPYDPEAVWTYELGTKARLLDNSVDAEVALFYSDYEDVVANAVPPPPALPQSYYFNAGSARVRGIDFSVTAQVTDAMSFGLKANYTDTEFVEINALAADHAVGDPLDLIPEYSGSAWGRYDFSWGGSPGFVRLDYMRQGRSEVRNRTLWAPPAVAESWSDVIDLVNLNLGWQWSTVALGVFANNLRNERGYLDPLAIEGRATRPRPRTYGISFGLSF